MVEPFLIAVQYTLDVQIFRNFRFHRLGFLELAIQIHLSGLMKNYYSNFIFSHFV